MSPKVWYMDASLQSIVTRRLELCLKRVSNLRAMLSELAEEVQDLHRIVVEADAEHEVEALRAMLELHQAEIMRLLSRDHDHTTPTLSEPSAPHAFPFRLDPFNREVRIGRRRVLLTQREMEVMELLWEQMPAPVSREAILNRLYGDSATRSERVIDVHIHNIRQKLRASGATDVSIKSWAKQGWALVLPLLPTSSEGTLSADVTGSNRQE